MSDIVWVNDGYWLSLSSSCQLGTIQENVDQIKATCLVSITVYTAQAHSMPTNLNTVTLEKGEGERPSKVDLKLNYI